MPKWKIRDGTIDPNLQATMSDTKMVINFVSGLQSIVLFDCVLSPRNTKGELSTESQLTIIESCRCHNIWNQQMGQKNVNERRTPLS